MPFQFEKLEVYQVSLDYVESVNKVCRSIKGKVSHNIINQLSRASWSIPLNIAESNGRWHAKDKKQFLWIARGSVFECVPIIDICFREGFVTNDEFKSLYTRLERISKMLTKLISHFESAS